MSVPVSHRVRDTAWSRAWEATEAAAHLWGGHVGARMLTVPVFREGMGTTYDQITLMSGAVTLIIRPMLDEAGRPVAIEFAGRAEREPSFLAIQPARRRFVWDPTTDVVTPRLSPVARRRDGLAMSLIHEQWIHTFADLDCARPACA